MLGLYFQYYVFDEDPFACQCEKEDRNSLEFKIWHFYWSFSSDVMAVKGLNTWLDIIIPHHSIALLRIIHTDFDNRFIVLCAIV